MGDRDQILAVVVAVTIALLSAGFAAGFAIQAAPAPRPALPPPDCAEWTDQCVVCQRTDGGTACSTPGIACIRGPLSCLRRL